MCPVCYFKGDHPRWRRFRLSDPRKNEERKKKRALLVSFPRATLVVNMPHGILLSSPLPTPSEQIHMTPSLLISLLVSSFLSGPVLSVAVSCSAGHEAIKNTIASTSGLNFLVSPCCAMLRLKVPMQLHVIAMRVQSNKCLDGNV